MHWLNPILSDKRQKLRYKKSVETGCFGCFFFTKNNCKIKEPIKIIKQLIREKYELLFHNCKFDIEVMEEWFNIPITYKFHDSLFLAFLHNPHERVLKLKSLISIE